MSELTFSEKIKELENNLNEVAKQRAASKEQIEAITAQFNMLRGALAAYKEVESQINPPGKVTELKEHKNATGRNR